MEIDIRKTLRWRDPDPCERLSIHMDPIEAAQLLREMRKNFTVPEETPAGYRWATLRMLDMLQTALGIKPDEKIENWVELQ